MPALQVRDFPEELYEHLKEYAEHNHRSIAQQTIVAVEQMIAADERSAHQNNEAPTLTPKLTHWRNFDTENDIAARINKRNEIFARADSLRWKGPMPTSEEIVATIHAARNTHDTSTLEACGFYDEVQSGKSTDDNKGFAKASGHQKAHNDRKSQ